MKQPYLFAGVTVVTGEARPIKMHSYISSTENCTVIKRTSLLCSLYKEYFGVVHISIMWIDLQLLRIG